MAVGAPERRRVAVWPCRSGQIFLDDRYGQKATLVTSQLLIEHWHDVIGEPTFADAILDRLVHHAHRITLKGPSMRNRKPASTSSADPAAT